MFWRLRPTLPSRNQDTFSLESSGIGPDSMQNIGLWVWPNLATPLFPEVTGYHHRACLVALLG